MKSAFRRKYMNTISWDISGKYTTVTKKEERKRKQD